MNAEGFWSYLCSRSIEEVKSEDFTTERLEHFINEILSFVHPKNDRVVAQQQFSRLCASLLVEKFEPKKSCGEIRSADKFLEATVDEYQLKIEISKQGKMKTNLIEYVTVSCLSEDESFRHISGLLTRLSDPPFYDARDSTDVIRDRSSEGGNTKLEDRAVTSSTYTNSTSAQPENRNTLTIGNCVSLNSSISKRCSVHVTEETPQRANEDQPDENGTPKEGNSSKIEAMEPQFSTAIKDISINENIMPMKDFSLKTEAIDPCFSTATKHESTRYGIPKADIFPESVAIELVVSTANKIESVKCERSPKDYQTESKEIELELNTARKDNFIFKYETSTGVPAEKIKPATSTDILAEKIKPTVSTEVPADTSVPTTSTGVPTETTKPITSSGVPSETTEPTASTGVPAEASVPTTSTGVSVEITKPTTSTGVPADTIKPTKVTGIHAKTSVPTTATEVPVETSVLTTSTGLPAETSELTTSTRVPAEKTETTTSTGLPGEATKPATSPGLPAEISETTMSTGVPAETTKPTTTSGVPAKTTEPTTSPGVITIVDDLNNVGSSVSPPTTITNGSSASDGDIELDFCMDACDYNFPTSDSEFPTADPEFEKLTSYWKHFTGLFRKEGFSNLKLVFIGRNDERVTFQCKKVNITIIVYLDDQNLEEIMFQVKEINVKTLSRLILTLCGNEGTKQTPEQAGLRRLLQAFITKIKGEEEKCLKDVKISCFGQETAAFHILAGETENPKKITGFVDSKGEFHINEKPTDGYISSAVSRIYGIMNYVYTYPNKYISAQK